MSAGSLAYPLFDSQVPTSEAGFDLPLKSSTDEWRCTVVMESCALYARALPNRIDQEAEFAHLRRFAKRRGWEVGEEYSDMAGVESGHGLDALLRDARRGRFDLILVTQFSRFAQSPGRLSRLVLELRRLGIDFVSCRDGVETTGSCRHVVDAFFSALRRMESDLESERALSPSGADRKPGRPVSPLDPARVVQLREQGLSLRSIARLLGVSHSTIGRHLKRGADSPEESS